MNINYIHPSDQLVMFMQRIYDKGLTTTSGGNLSIIDDDGNIWITPASVDKGTLTRNDIICVKPDGTCVGPHKPSSELPFHAAVYKMRPDLKAVLHAHPPALVSFSIVRKCPDLDLVPSVRKTCKDVRIAVYAVPGSIYSRASQGPLHLLRTGAIPVTRPREILEEYRYRYGAKIHWEPSEPETAAPVKPTAAKEQPVPQAEEVTIREKRPLPADADETMVKIYGILSEIPIHVDEIAAQTQKNPAEVLTALSELEIMGFVSANAGRRFSIS